MSEPQTVGGAKVPLEEYILPLAGRNYTILHTGIPLTVDEENQAVTGLLKVLPYGTALWPASIALAYEIASRGDALAGKTVLELGAGTGLPGIVAASFGADVTSTDQHEMVMSLGRLNGRRNGVSERLDYRLVDWRDWQDEQTYDLILGADILYYDTLHPDLWRIFQNNLARGGHILLADGLRPPGKAMFDIFEAHKWPFDVQMLEIGEGDDHREFGMFDVMRPDQQ